MAGSRPWAPTDARLGPACAPSTHRALTFPSASLTVFAGKSRLSPSALQSTRHARNGRALLVHHLGDDRRRKRPARRRRLIGAIPRVDRRRRGWRGRIAAAPGERCGQQQSRQPSACDRGGGVDAWSLCLDTRNDANVTVDSHAISRLLLRETATRSRSSCDGSAARGVFRCETSSDHDLDRLTAPLGRLACRRRGRGRTAVKRGDHERETARAGGNRRIGGKSAGGPYARV